jgi:hypothetical protein
MDVVTLARTARENLARGLGALQSPGVPETLLKAAEPVAQAMNALHRIESSRGGPGSDPAAALAQVRMALNALQAAGVRHPAVEQATEAIAGALGLVHQLTAALGQGSVVPSPPTQPSGTFQAPGEARPQVAVVNQPPWQQPAPASPAVPTQAAAPNWGQQTAPVGQAWQPPPQAPAQQAGWQQATQPAATAPQAYPQEKPAQAQVTPNGMLRYEAELGAHSSTNFYKGLSGNDVIDSGGIFIATYNIPEVGQPLAVKVSLPGGYEFEAAAVVRWTRDSPQSGADSSPGFGAQFTQISAEGRQLVYRYVRNREPLFYDDL